MTAAHLGYGSASPRIERRATPATRGLNPMEVAAISGHRSMQMLARYTHIRPTSLLDKLG